MSEKYYDHVAYKAQQQPTFAAWEAVEQGEIVKASPQSVVEVQPIPIALESGVSAKQTDTALTTAQATGIRLRYMLVLAVAFGLLLAILGAWWGVTGPGASIVLGMFGTVTVGAIGFIWLNGQDHKHSVHGVERQRGEIAKHAINQQADINMAIVDNDRLRIELDHEYRMEKMRLYQNHLRGSDSE
ncbi:MAG: hypothetical protein H6641_15755 [Caldilineaceae bacterium]|nr:hypothetical protein [Caldilineaceae bacterium]